MPNASSRNVPSTRSCDSIDCARYVQAGRPAGSKEAPRPAPAVKLAMSDRTHGTALGIDGVAVVGALLGLGAGVAVVGESVGEGVSPGRDVVGDGVVGGVVGLRVGMEVGALLGLGVGALLGPGVGLEVGVAVGSAA